MNGEDKYFGRSWVSGNEIWLGIYEDEELKILSFFHELAHVFNKRFPLNYITKYQMEKAVWNTAFLVARKYGYTFSEKAIEWADKQLETYTCQ